MVILLTWFLGGLAFAESMNNPYDAGREIQGILLSAKSAAEKVRLLEPYTKVPSPDVKSLACLALAALADKSSEKTVEELSGALMKEKQKEPIRAGALCLALTGKPEVVDRIAPLVAHKSDLLRNDAAVLLTKFVDNPKAAQALLPVLKIKSEKESHIPYNVIQALRGWSEPTMLDGLAQYLAASLKSKKFFNSEGLVRIFVFTADTNPKSLEQIKLAMSRPRSFSSVADGMTPAPFDKPSEKARELLEEALLSTKISAIDKSGIPNRLVAFRNPKSLEVFAKALQSCDEYVCENLVWSAAAFPGKRAREIVTKATAHRSPGAVKVARSILDYWDVKEKDRFVLQLLGKDVKEQGKLNFDKFDNRNEIVQLAARDENGIGAETFEMMFATYENTMALPWEELMRAYLWRFAPDNRAPALLAGRLGESFYIRKRLIEFLESRPDSTVCTTLYQFYLRKSDSYFTAEEPLLKLAGLRQRGFCR